MAVILSNTGGITTSAGSSLAPPAALIPRAPAPAAAPSFWESLKTRPPFDIAGIIRQAVHGVFRADGRQLGSYESYAELCAGRWLVFKGETSLPLSQLFVTFPGGRLVPVPQHCSDQGLGTPSFATPAQKKAIAYQRAKAKAGPIGLLMPKAAAAPGGDQAAGDDGDYGDVQKQLATLALYGAAGLLALSLLSAGRRT
jgi:hypothetical protein